jgi:hypothetical protein
LDRSIDDPDRYLELTFGLTDVLNTTPAGPWFRRSEPYLSLPKQLQQPMRDLAHLVASGGISAPNTGDPLKRKLVAAVLDDLLVPWDKLRGERMGGPPALRDGPRRERDPEIVRRDKEIAKMIADGNDAKSIRDRYQELDVGYARKIKSRLKAAIAARIAQGVKDDDLRREFGFRPNHTREQILRAFGLA